VFCTDVFVAELDYGPMDLTDESQSVLRRQVGHSDAAYRALGNAHHAGGPVEALKTLIDRCGQVMRSEDWTSYASRASESRHARQLLATQAIVERALQVQETLGYKFNNIQILVDALSLGTLEFERLEFIGDAALDLVTVSYWIDKDPTTDRGPAQVRSSSTCNQFLAMVCIELGLHRQIECGPEVRGEFAQAMTLHNDALAENPSWDFWMELDYPKSLADALEALFGAVYIDSDFGIDTVRSVFKKILLPTIERCISVESTTSEHALFKRCSHVQYRPTIVLPAQDGNPTCECTVELGGIELAKATSTQPQLAKRIASRKVLQKLQSDPCVLATLCKYCAPSVQCINS
jgi:endoribonuclease Dicer